MIGKCASFRYQIILFQVRCLGSLGAICSNIKIGNIDCGNARVAHLVKRKSLIELVITKINRYARRNERNTQTPERGGTSDIATIKTSFKSYYCQSVCGTTSITLSYVLNTMRKKPRRVAVCTTHTYKFDRILWCFLIRTGEKQSEK